MSHFEMKNPVKLAHKLGKLAYPYAQNAEWLMKHVLRGSNVTAKSDVCSIKRLATDAARLVGNVISCIL